MARSVRISLALKCQLLFGAAVILILATALSVVWVRMQGLVRQGQEETARKLADAWLSGRIELGVAIRTVDDPLTLRRGDPGLALTLIRKEEFDYGARDPFLASAIRTFQTVNDRQEEFQQAVDDAGRPYYRFARAIRKSDLARIQGGSAAGFVPTLGSVGLADPLEMVLLLQLRADQAERQLAVNRIYIVAAGLVAGLLAIAAFWFITMRLILSPVRVLRDTAQKIGEGDLNIRSDINTGDEFEQLSDTFNRMVESLRQSQEKLQEINKSLDLKLVELSRVNLALHEANQIKNDFLANVSHELRTPLNSIIGFAEVLEETLRDRTGPVDEKRKRYCGNIITASRRLLDLINELLDLAKIEAGRMDVNIGPVSIADTAEGLVGLIRPQAEKRKISLELKIEPNIPLVHTDAGKLQQIVFNFLANAVKFTPEGGAVTVSARLEPPANGNKSDPAAPPRVRISVRDNGPGIPPDKHDRIFEKFTQLDAAVTKEFGGSGLGLAISKELSRLLQGTIEVDSDVGRGATFSLIIPLKLEEKTAPLMPEISASALPASQPATQ